MILLTLLSSLTLSAADLPSPPPPVPATLSALRIAATPSTPSTDLTLTATIHVYSGGYIDLPLGMEQLILWEATLDGRLVPLPPAPTHRRLTAELSPGIHTLQLRGLLISLTPQARLTLPPQTPTVLQLDAPGLDVSVVGGVPLGGQEVALVPTEALELTWKPATPPPPRPPRLLVESAVGLSVESGGIEGQARLNYRALHGPVSTVQVRLGGPVDLVEASGPAVQSSQLQGDLLVISLTEPLEGDFSVDLSFRGPAPRGGVPLMVPEADRAEGWVSLLVSEEGYLEQSALSLEPVLPTAVPIWAQGLAPGSLLATWRYAAGTHPSLTVRAQRWETLESPGTLIDEAELRVAHTAHGRTLTRARLMVRNDRRQYLGVTLPPDSTLLVARVAGTPVEVVRHGDQIRVPLEKSVETLTGLISFPLELTWLSQTTPWRHRGRGAALLSAPTFDAPITQLRWSVLLPPGIEARRVQGRAIQVVRQEAPPPPAAAPLPAQDPFWSMLTLIDPARHRFSPWRRARPAEEEPVESSVEYAVDDAEKDLSMELWTRAYSAYKDNDFDQAGALLEESLRWDASNAASQALLDNVGVLQGESEVAGAQAERIKALARSRSGEAEAQQRVLLEEAEDLYRAGDMDRALEQYSQALIVTDQLARLEDSNANVQKASSSALREKLKKVEEERDSRSILTSEISALGEEVEELRPPEEPVLLDGNGWQESEQARYRAADEGEAKEEDEEAVYFGYDANNNGPYLSDPAMFTDDDRMTPQAAAPPPSPEPMVPARDEVGRRSPLANQDAAVASGADTIAIPSTETEVPSGSLMEALPSPVDLYELAPVYATQNRSETLSQEFLARIPAGRSYQSAVQLSGGVTGEGAGASLAGLDDLRISLGAGRGRENANVAGAAANENVYLPPTRADVVLAADVMIIPEGVTSSQWIVLVPDTGLAVELERQLLGEGEAVGAQVRYQVKRGE